jgi:hypothetical protein
MLVRNQIRDMLGGQTGKITFGKLNINLGLRAKTIPSWYNILVHCEGANLKAVHKFMTYLSRGGIRPTLSKGLWPYCRFNPLRTKHPLKLWAYINRTAVYAWSGMWSWSESKLNSETILGWHTRESKLKGKYWTITKRCIFVDEISGSAGHKYFNCEYWTYRN